MFLPGCGAGCGEDPDQTARSTLQSTMADEQTSVRVAVRVRPQTPKERSMRVRRNPKPFQHWEKSAHSLLTAVTAPSRDLKLVHVAPCRTPGRLPDRLLSSRAPSRGRALTSSRRCRWGARPGSQSRRPRACPPPLNRTTNLPRENRRACGAEGGRARPQRAPSTRRNARKKPPAHFFRAF